MSLKQHQSASQYNNGINAPFLIFLKATPNHGFDEKDALTKKHVTTKIAYVDKDPNAMNSPDKVVIEI